jgi:hypothetical protein
MDKDMRGTHLLDKNDIASRNFRTLLVCYRVAEVCSPTSVYICARFMILFCDFTLLMYGKNRSKDTNASPLSLRDHIIPVDLSGQ